MPGFEARLATLGPLRHIVDALWDLAAADAQVEIDPCAGVSLQAMDPSHVCLAQLRMRPDAFERFRCECPMTVAVHLGHLARILRCGASDAPVELGRQDDDVLTVLLGDDGEYQLRLMEPAEGDQLLDVPDDADMAAIDMPASEYARTFRDLASLGEDVSMSRTEDATALVLRVDGDFARARVRLEMPADSGGPTGELGRFGLRHMASFARPGLAQALRLSLSPGAPARVRYEAYGGAAQLVLMVAPKADEEPDN